MSPENRKMFISGRAPEAAAASGRPGCGGRIGDAHARGQRGDAKFPRSAERRAETSEARSKRDAGETRPRSARASAREAPTPDGRNHRRRSGAGGTETRGRGARRGRREGRGGRRRTPSGGRARSAWRRSRIPDGRRARAGGNTARPVAAPGPAEHSAKGERSEAAPSHARLAATSICARRSTSLRAAVQRRFPPSPSAGGLAGSEKAEASRAPVAGLHGGLGGAARGLGDPSRRRVV